MAVEMELSTTDGDLELIWEKIRPVQRFSCPELQDVKSVLRQTNDTPGTGNDDRRIHATLLQVKACSSRLEQKLDHCVWMQKVFIVLVMGLTALWGLTLYIHYSAGYSKWSVAEN